MRVIHLMSTDDYSGAENVAINIVNELNNLGIETYYATQKGKIDEFLSEKNVKNIIHIKKLSIKEIRRIEKEYNPDIIHAHDYRASFLTSMACKNSKIISHIHNNPLWIKNFLHPFSWAFLFASKKISKILIVSDSIKNEYIFSNKINDKLIKVGNPLDRKTILSKVSNNIEKYYDLCFTGRLSSQKNPVMFIELVKKLKEKKQNIKAIMIGDGELKKDCLELIDKYELKQNIEMKGFLKNPYEEMYKSKVFCLPSIYEGFGLVVFEALTLGLPSVVSKVGGLVEIVNEKCGKTCRNKEEFEKELIELITNERYYKEKSDEAIIRSKELENFNAYMDNIIKIYNGIYKGEREEKIS